MKNQKIITLSIFALAIGAATILPLAYLTPRPVAAQTDPLFDVDIFYANVIPYIYDEDVTAVNVFANFTKIHELADLKGVDAKIEVYKFHVYSDQGSIANLVHTFTMARNIPDPPNAPKGVTQAIIASGTTSWTFADGTTCNITDALGSIDGRAGMSLDDVERYVIGHVSTGFSAKNSEQTVQAANLENAQTIYVDVTRVMTITYKLQTNPDSLVASTTTTLANNEVLGHIELTKTDFGFASGDVPDIMFEGDTWAYMLPPPFTKDIFGFLQSVTQTHVETAKSTFENQRITEDTR